MACGCGKSRSEAGRAQEEGGETPVCHEQGVEAAAGGCCGANGRPDYLLRFGSTVLAVALAARWLLPEHSLPHRMDEFVRACAALVGQMTWGLAAGIFFVGLLARVPKELVMGALGPGGRCSGLFRAIAAGVALDLCSHGILLVGMQLYRRGASLGQTAAFLIASPWNSLSLTFILMSLIGLPWTVVFLLLSCVVAFSGGWFLDHCVRRGVLPANPHARQLPADFQFWPSLRASWRAARFDRWFWRDVGVNGLKESRMLLRWIFLGVILAASLRAGVDTADFQRYFGPTVIGLVATLLATTVIEVCSEGSSPIAADLLTRAGAPGNAFTFLMAGVATDYTEILVLRETTRSWKTALFLPLATVPQTLVLGWLLNHWGGG